MFMPSIFGESLFDEWMDAQFAQMNQIDRALYGKHADHVMKTDVKENENGYEVEMDLPGFKKEQLSVQLNNGYLTVRAAKGLDKDEKDKSGRLIRQERYAGSMQRSFYVGSGVTEQDITARFEDGVLHLNLPKKDVRRLPESHQILIGD